MNLPRKLLTYGILTLVMSIASLAQDYSKLPLPREILNSSRVSDRCKFLTEKRMRKIELRNRALSLIEQNRQLQATSPRYKQGAKNKLEANEVKLIEKMQDLEKDGDKLSGMMILSGCPGVAYKLRPLPPFKASNPNAVDNDGMEDPIESEDAMPMDIEDLEDLEEDIDD